jgi:hypothetical protein
MDTRIKDPPQAMRLCLCRNSTPFDVLECIEDDCGDTDRDRAVALVAIEDFSRMTAGDMDVGVSLRAVPSRA